MKKLLSLALALVLIMSMTTITALAAEELPTPTPPSVFPTLPTTTPATVTTGGDADIDVTGWIGIQNIDGLIDVSYTTKTSWFASVETDGFVHSADFYVENKSTSIDLAVSFVEFTLDNDSGSDEATIKNNLVLILRDALAIAGDPNLAAGNSTAFPYTPPLKCNDGTNAEATYKWTYGYTGSYSGEFPKSGSLDPKYELVLNFALFDNYLIPDETP